MRVAIIGLGLIGGSLGLALKRSGRQDLEIIGVPRRAETLEKAIEIGAIDRGTTDHVAGAKEADLIFICTPMHLIIPILKEIAPSLKSGAVITDVGSSKGELVSQAEKLVAKGTCFVGGHPMAGKETTKLKSADPDLFKGKIWILTKTAKTSPKALELLKELTAQTGANPIILEPKIHDLIVAAISHLPLAVAAALVDSVAEAKKAKEQMKLCAASGFKDTTRIASGDPILGVDMFTTNKQAVLQTLAAFKKSLAKIEKLIKGGDADKIETALKKAKNFRDSIYGQTGN